MITANRGRAVQAMFGILLGGTLCACAQNTQPIIATRPKSQSVVYVEGRGRVVSPTLRIRCGPGVAAEESSCVSWPGLPMERLFAEAEPGWEFERWESRRLEPACDGAYLYAEGAPAAGPTFAYTAVFVPRRQPVVVADSLRR